MADHVRKQIRDAVVDALTGLTTTGSNVFVRPAWTRTASQLPAIEVETPVDQVDTDLSYMGSSGASYYRRLVVRLHVIGKGATVQDTLDQVAKEIEVALYADQTLGGLAKSIAGLEVEQELTDEQDKPTGRQVVDVTYLYTVRGGAPDVAL